MSCRKRFSARSVFTLAIAVVPASFSQSTGSTVTATVLDPDKMLIPQASVEIRNPVTGFTKTVTANDAGVFQFNNVPTACMKSGSQPRVSPT